MDGMPLEDGMETIRIRQLANRERQTSTSPEVVLVPAKYRENAPILYRLIPTGLSGGKIDVRLF